MKTMKILMFLCINSLLISAQPYGQNLYAHAGSRLTSGVHTTINSPGFFMIGCRVPTVGRPFNFSVDKTDVGGAFGGSNDIMLQYQILNGGVTCASPLSMVTTGCAVTGIETYISGTPDAWYALAGAFDDNIFFATLDAAGAPLTQVKYLFPSTGGSGKPIIIESSTPTEYFIAGAYNGNSIYALRVDASGTVLWSNIVNDVPNINLIETYDVVESPYSSEILVVGHMVHPPGANRASDGFICRFNASTGSLNAFDTYGGPGNSCDSFQAITVANSTNSGSNGFVLIGSLDPYNSSGQAWLVKIDPTGGYLWTTEFSPATAPTARRTVDVFERLNASAVYEYYGEFLSGSNGMGVIKFDDTGVPVGGGVNNEFVYALNASDPTCLSFENTSGGPDEGLHVYGTDYSGTGDHYLVEAYFSGESGCNETLTMASSVNGPNSVVSPPLYSVGTLQGCSKFGLRTVLYDDYGANNQCSASSITGGSNARIATTTGISQQFNNNSYVRIVPNPVVNEANICYSLKQQSKVKIDLLNYLGQHIQTIQSFTTKASGDHKIAANLNDYNLESGVYFIQLNIDGKISNEKIIYTK